MTTGAPREFYDSEYHFEEDAARPDEKRIWHALRHLQPLPHAARLALPEGSEHGDSEQLAADVVRMVQRGTARIRRIGVVPQQVHAAEAQMPSMPDDVAEGYRASPALEGVHPVAGPGILDHIAFAAIPDIKTVERVKQNRQPDAEQFQPNHKRKTAQELNLLGISARALGGKRVRNKMLHQKKTDGDDSAQRVQTPQQK